MVDLIRKRYKVNLPAQLMECEKNYHYLSRLLGKVDQLMIGHQRELTVGHQHKAEGQVVFSILEQTKYTTVVHIVHHLPLQKTDTSIKNVSLTHYSTLGAASEVASEFTLDDERRKRRQPLSCRDVLKGVFNGKVYQGDVRLYHDANVAEVVKCQRYRQFKPRYKYPNLDMHQVDEKAQMNRFLGELLAHCLAHGRVAEPVMILKC